MRPLINILIRTSSRPELFTRCLKSVTDQNYPNIRVIVSIDRDCDYVPNWCEVVRVTPDLSKKFYYDYYLNNLKDLVTEGYFYFQDDDDYLLPNVFNQIVFDNPVIIHKLNHLGKILPPSNQITMGLIGFPCIMMHHSLKNIAHIATDDHCDYHFIKEVENKVDFVYRDLILVESDQKGYGV